MRDRARPFAGISLSNVGPGWAAKAIAQLEADVAAGAVGVGEIGGSFGESTRKADGTRLQLDDPELEPVWAACARLKLPVFIHTGYPQEFYRSVDYTNERWLELSLFPDRRVLPEEGLRFNDLMAERDRLFRRNPKTTFVAAHMGWHANDLGRLGKLLDEAPNVNVEVGAVLYDLDASPAQRTTSSLITRTASSSGRILRSQRNTLTTGACSRRKMITSTTTATITRSGSCMGSLFLTRF